MTRDELWDKVTNILADEWAQPNARVADRVLSAVYAALREATPAMTRAFWDAASVEGASIMATTSWLVMLDASPLKPPEPTKRS